MDANAWLTPIHRGLLYKEWLAHRNVIVGFWALWLACGLVLPVFHHPGWILALGLLYVFLVAARVAGADALDGSEEFAFALPPTRRQIFLVRLALAGGNLAALLAIGLLCIALDLPQRLWGLVVESGLTEPFPHAEGPWYAFACCTPLAVFACVFVLAALARTPARVGLASILGLLGAGVATGVALAAEAVVWYAVHFRPSAVSTAEDLTWKGPTGLIACPALLVLAAAILGLGLVFYERKEGVSRPGAPEAASGFRWWIWIVVALLVVLGLVFLM
jgi:hypothetical protein